MQSDRIDQSADMWSPCLPLFCQRDTAHRKTTLFDTAYSRHKPQILCDKGAAMPPAFQEAKHARPVLSCDGWPFHPDRWPDRGNLSRWLFARYNRHRAVQERHCHRGVYRYQFTSGICPSVARSR